jgi:hypothetical protein
MKESVLQKAHMDIGQEYLRAADKFSKFNSFHEGYAVIREELDELWDEIKGGQDKQRMREEAMQVGAMALRFMADLCEVDE